MNSSGIKVELGTEADAIAIVNDFLTITFNTRPSTRIYAQLTDNNIETLYQIDASILDKIIDAYKRGVDDIKEYQNIITSK